MNYYKLIVSYDGTDYCGWQSQTHGKTVQNAILAVFSKVFGRPCQLRAASRTDTGVHAAGQVVALRSEINIAPELLKTLLNTSLASAVQIVSAKVVEPNYNPHENVLQKTYQYRIFTAKPSPMNARFGWFAPMPERVNWHTMPENLKVFVGRHDFTAFARLEPGEVKVMTRQISSIKCSWPNENELLITITGHSFLRYQIRRMVGAVFELARKPKYSVAHLEQSLRTGQPLPPQIAFNAPPQGLCLEEIIYEESPH